MFTVHGNDRVTKLYAISGHASHVFHDDFFPRLVKYDKVWCYVAAGECMKNPNIWPSENTVHRTGYMGKTLVISAPYWKSIWRSPYRGRHFLGSFVIMIFWYHRTLAQSVMLS